MKKKNGSRQQKSSDDSKLLLEIKSQFKGLDIDGVISKLNEIHNSKLDEQEKLKRKDLFIIAEINKFDEQLQGAKPWIQKGLADMFVSLLRALIGIEMVLWELKKLPGDPPFDPPSPEPSPGP